MTGSEHRDVDGGISVTVDRSNTATLLVQIFASEHAEVALLDHCTTALAVPLRYPELVDQNYTSPVRHGLEHLLPRTWISWPRIQTACYPWMRPGFGTAVHLRDTPSLPSLWLHGGREVVPSWTCSPKTPKSHHSNRKRTGSYGRLLYSEPGTVQTQTRVARPKRARRGRRRCTRQTASHRERPAPADGQKMQRQFDLLVFGATGFTGARLCAYVSTLGLQRWAVAGRCENKLRQLVRSLPCAATGTPVAIVADCDDPGSLDAAFQEAIVVINCVGPYRLYGEQVVASCLRSQTHYVDVCGEPEFMERIALHYNEQAIERKVYILCGCAFESIPASLGVIYCMQHADPAKGDICSIESTIFLDEDRRCSIGHETTFQSLVLGLSNVEKLKAVRKKARELKGANVRYRQAKIETSFFPSYARNKEAWSIPFLGADVSVVRRMFAEIQHESASIMFPRYNALIAFRTTLYMILVCCMALLVSLFLKLPYGKEMLLSYPSIFTFGMFTKVGPTEEHLSTGRFLMEFIARDEHRRRLFALHIKGPEPGYVTTPICAAQAAVTLLEERCHVKGKGGVLTPGYALHETTYVDRLKKEGIAFELLL